MDAARLLTTYGSLWSPLTFAALVSVAVALVWLALAPARPGREVDGRLDGYLARGDAFLEEELSRPLAARTLVPALRLVLRTFGRLLPRRNAEQVRLTLEQAGHPMGLTVMDFYGLRILLPLLLGGGAFLLLAPSQGPMMALRYTAGLAVIAFMLPGVWLNGRAKRRRHAILRAFPDMMDMLTIGVEAGLGFESALVRVAEQWDNALTRELRRAVAEMRIGVGRDEALRRMAERTAVEEIESFVGVLIQSSALGVSIAQVLHSQAAQVRTRRRLRAEEKAHQAGTKMIIPLVFLIFPAMFVVILGPAVPILMDAF